MDIFTSSVVLNMYIVAIGGMVNIFVLKIFKVKFKRTEPYISAMYFFIMFGVPFIGWIIIGILRPIVQTLQAKYA